MKITILGASGKLGSLTAEHVRNAFPNAELILTSRSGGAGEEWLQFDPFVDDWAKLGRPDVLVNCIGAIQGNADDFEAVHVGLAELIIGHQEELGRPHLVQLSALGARPNHTVPFLGTKGRADALLMAELDSVVVVRPSIVCTENTMVAQKMRKLLRIGRMMLGKLLVPKGFPDTCIQPVMPADLGEIMVAAMRKSGDNMAVEVVGPDRVPFRQVLEWMQSGSNRKLRIVELPRDMIDGFVRHFMSVWFPDTINYDQFQLLFLDNVGEVGPMAEWLNKMPAGTKEFWQRESER